MSSRAGDEIQVLVFNIMGVKMGVDTEQIYEMKDLHQAEAEGIDIARFHEKIPFRDGHVSYKSPKVLLIKNKGAASGIIIDEPQDIISISIDSIRPLPFLLETFKKSKAVWGAAIRDDEVILLVDFLKA